MGTNLLPLHFRTTPNIITFVVTTINRFVIRSVVFTLSQVDRTYDDGNREGAVEKSKNAKYWSMTAIVFGMLGIIGVSFYGIFFHLVPSIS